MTHSGDLVGRLHAIEEEEKKLLEDQNMAGSDKNEIVEIDVNQIAVNPFQPRKDFNEEEISELAESIKTHGLIQPIILRKIADHYQVIAGERRLRACKKTGLAKIPSIIIDIDGVDVAEISLIENIQRKNLNCLEESAAYNILKSKFGMIAEDIAKRVGKSRPYVSNTMRLMSLPDSVKDALFNNQISMGHGRALVVVENAEAQEEILQTIMRNSLSVRQTEDLIARMLGNDGTRKERKRKKLMESLFEDESGYYQEIKRVINDFKKRGGKADIIERETEDYLEIVVRISK